MGCSVLVVKESFEAAFDVIVLYYLPTYLLCFKPSSRDIYCEDETDDYLVFIGIKTGDEECSFLYFFISFFLVWVLRPGSLAFFEINVAIKVNSSPLLPPSSKPAERRLPVSRVDMYK